MSARTSGTFRACQESGGVTCLQVTAQQDDGIPTQHGVWSDPDEVVLPHLEAMGPAQVDVAVFVARSDIGPWPHPRWNYSHRIEVCVAAAVLCGWTHRTTSTHPGSSTGRRQGTH